MLHITANTKAHLNRDRNKQPTPWLIFSQTIVDWSKFCAGCNTKSRFRCFTVGAQIEFYSPIKAYGSANKWNTVRACENVCWGRRGSRGTPFGKTIEHEFYFLFCFHFLALHKIHAESSWQSTDFVALHFHSHFTICSESLCVCERVKTLLGLIAFVRPGQKCVARKTFDDCLHSSARCSGIFFPIGSLGATSV